MRIKITAFILLFWIPQVNAQTTGAGADFLYAQRLYMDEMYDVAARQFHEFAVEYPESPKAPEALKMAGDAYFKIEDYENARKEYIYLTLQYPDAGDIDAVHFKIAECFKAQKDHLRAAHAFQQMKVLYPKSQLVEESMVEAARMFVLSGDYGAAVENITTYINTFPGSKYALEMRLELVELLSARDDMQRALIEIDKILSVTRQGSIRAEALLIQSDIVERLGRLDESEAILTSMSATYASDKEISNKVNLRLGTLYQNRGLFDKSNQYLSEIQNDSLATRMMADNYFQTGQYSQSLDKYVALSDTLDPEIGYRTGLCKEKTEDYRGAAETFGRMTDRCGDLCGPLHLALARVHLKLNDDDNALRYLVDFGNKYPHDPCQHVARFKIAEIYETVRSDPDRALRLYFDYVQQFPTSRFVDDAQYAIGRCYEMKGEAEQSIREYRTYLAVYPGAPLHEQALQRIDHLEKYALPARNETMSKLAGLLSNVIESPAHYFQLAMTYFNDLKDYENAARLFRKTLRSQTAEISKSIIQYHLGESFYRLAGSNDASEIAYLDSARFYFQGAVDDDAGDGFADDAAYRLIQIETMMPVNELEHVEAFDSLLQRYLDAYPAGSCADEALYRLAISAASQNPVDSMRVTTLTDKILSDFSSSRFSGPALYAKANVYVKLNDASRARSLLERYISEYATGSYIPQAKYKLALLDIEAGSHDQALENLDRLTIDHFYSSYSDSARARVGELFLQTNRIDEGILYFQKLMDEGCKSEDIHQTFREDESLFRLAQYHRETGDRSSSIALFQEHLRTYPDSPNTSEALFQLASYLSNGSPYEKELALSYLTRLLDEHPKSSRYLESLILSGDMLYENEAYARARDKYLEAISVGGADVLEMRYPHMQAIKCLYMMDRIQDGDKERKRFEKMYDDVEMYLGQIELSRGDYFTRRKNFKEAEKVYKSAKSRFKENKYGAEAELALGKLYMILNRDEEALEILTDMPEKYAGSDVIPEVYLALGEFYYVKARQVESAMLAYRNAIEHPTISDSHLMQGMHALIRCYVETHLWDRALLLSREFIEKFPVSENTFEVRIQIGTIYYQLREYDRAIEYLSQLKHEAGREDEPRIQYWIADSYMEKGDYDRAISEFLKVRYISKPTKLNWAVTAQFKAGLAYMKLGEMLSARNVFSKIVREQGIASPFGKGAQAKIEEIESM
ncbi:MAG: tetratricopeptide repeat protein [candidate division KSB1 bacterium]|jgi:TolA-binding protein|nr:tetratricopeptide repeat protein [candidate division KSB1 bacterium]